MGFGSLSPVAVQQFFDGNGDPLAGGRLAFFLAGTSTPTPAYADFALATPLPNPVILDAAGRAPALFLDALSYKQTLADAAGVPIWSVDNIVTPTALRSAADFSSVTGPAHDVPVPAGLISYLIFVNSAPVTVDGFAGGVPGQLLVVRANTAQVDLVHAATPGVGSAPDHRLFNFVRSGPTSLTGGQGTAVYLYQSNGWVLIQHEQGGWIRVPYLAANFHTGGTPGTAWTVEAADVAQLDYKLLGTTLLLTVAIQASSVTGTPPALWLTGLPYQWQRTANFLPATVVDGAWQMGLAGMQADSPTLEFVRTDFGNWSASVNGRYVYFQGLGDVK